MKRFLLILMIITLTLSLCACSVPVHEDAGGDTDLGGLFRDLLHGARGDEPDNTELEGNDTAKPALPEECGEGSVLK